MLVSAHAQRTPPAMVATPTPVDARPDIETGHVHPLEVQAPNHVTSGAPNTRLPPPVTQELARRLRQARTWLREHRDDAGHLAFYGTLGTLFGLGTYYRNHDQAAGGYICIGAFVGALIASTATRAVWRLI